MSVIKPIFDNIINKIYGFRFSGWGMKTSHVLPWEYDAAFLRTNEYLKSHFDFSGDDGICKDDLDSLMWRHYIVSWCAKFAQKHNPAVPFVECGVCDGLTAYFSLTEMHDSTMHLYDAWKPSGSNFTNICIERVQANLSQFDNVIYHPGYIPESFEVMPGPPESISHLHIDLNNEMATLDALKYFYPRMAKNGVILFDDYAWSGFKRTKIVIDYFFKDKYGMLQVLPTGQAVYYVQ